ncbi:MAG TPA: acetylglutamate kinase [Dehalococcoidia bacterium]|nr:acetylglutamate kinase [Dehalococcoidia bacterium]
MSETSKRPIVVKIGGSTLGAEDTTLDDVVALHQAGERVAVVHGGGAMITDWLTRLDVPSEFVDGLRSTSAEAMEVVVAVLRGVINTQLVAAIVQRGGRAVGLSGVDGGVVRAERYDPRLGYVGRVTSVDGAFLGALMEAGAIPVIAPVGLEAPEQPLNINADTVAGEVARAVGARQLVFLTDVDGLLDGDGALIPALDAERAEALRAAGTLSGGMIPKVEACFRAAEAGAVAHMVNGRTGGTLRRVAGGEAIGTRIA